MQIDPLALSRSESISTPLASKTTAGNTSSTTKTTTKLPSSTPRIDFEPIYTDLKSSIGLQWPAYSDAITRFVQGGLNQHELNEILDPIFTPSDTALASKIESLHNQLICAILSNIGRDMPDDGVAAWVSSNEKPSAAPKPVSGDVAEQRVKTEVKNLPARDRRRIKTAGMKAAESNLDGIPKPGVIDIVEVQTTSGNRLKRSFDEYSREKNIKAPEVTPTSAGGLTKTNWDLEIRKRYTQLLFSETNDLPSEPQTLLSRLQPICYEESLPSGATLPVAELVSIAADTYVKEFLSVIFSRTRSNAPGSTGPASAAMMSTYTAGAGGSIGAVIMTAKYHKQLEKEEELWKKGEIQRSRETGLLPVEAKEMALRRPLGINDFKTAVEVGKGVVVRTPLIEHQIYDSWQEGELEDWRSEQQEYREWLKRKEKEDASAATLRSQNTNSHLSQKHHSQDQNSLDADGDADADADADGDPMDIDSIGINGIPNSNSTKPLRIRQEIEEDEPDDYGGWEGAGYRERNILDSVLGDILGGK